MTDIATLNRRALLGGAAALGTAALLPRAVLARTTAGNLPAERLWPHATALVERYVSQHKLPGAVAAFGWGTAPPSTISRGILGFDNPVPMGPDSLFRVYSMTKPVTGMAVMILIDEGKLGLDQPLAEILPEFANPRVAIDPDKGLEARPARGQITVRQLLTHTSGLGYSIGGNKVGAELMRLGVVPAVVSRMQMPGLTAREPTPGPDEFIRRAATVPLVAEPGTKWSYAMGLDILGLAMARLTGKSFAELMHERLFEPAGMTSTWFQVPPEAQSRLTTTYAIANGIAVPLDKGSQSIFAEPPAFGFGGAGLVTSPRDYDRFLQLLVNRGRIDGRQVIPERALAWGMSNLLPPDVSTKGTMAEGAGFGAGGKVGLGEEAGYFGWAGAAGTVGFANLRTGLRAGFYVQFMPANAFPSVTDFLGAVRADTLTRPPE
jgi:CubicO group peptidase (beta-lactamase class C family)